MNNENLTLEEQLAAAVEHDFILTVLEDDGTLTSADIAWYRTNFTVSPDELKELLLKNMPEGTTAHLLFYNRGLDSILIKNETLGISCRREPHGDKLYLATANSAPKNQAVSNFHAQNLYNFLALAKNGAMKTTILQMEGTFLGLYARLPYGFSTEDFETDKLTESMRQKLDLIYENSDEKLSPEQKQTLGQVSALIDDFEKGDHAALSKIREIKTPFSGKIYEDINQERLKYSRNTKVEGSKTTYQFETNGFYSVEIDTAKQYPLGFVMLTLNPPQEMSLDINNPTQMSQFMAQMTRKGVVQWNAEPPKPSPEQHAFNLGA